MFEYSSVSASSYDPGALVAKLNESTADGWEVVAIVPTGGDVSAFLRRESSSGTGPGSATDEAVEAGEGDTGSGAVAAFEETSVEDIAIEPVGAQPADDGWPVGETAAGAAIGSTVEEDKAADDSPYAPIDSSEATETALPVEEPPGWAVAPESPAEVSDDASEEATDKADDEQAPADTVVVDEVAPIGSTTSEADTPVSEATGVAPAEPSPEPAPAVTTPAGWYPDPSGRYELRYWDGGQWTEHVARQGQQFTDPPVR